MKDKIFTFLTILSLLIVAGCAQEAADEGVNDAAAQIAADDGLDETSVGTEEADTMEELVITSDAFKNNEMIPATYTCEGDDNSPPLNIENVPFNSVSFALIMDDPDAPSGTFVHWIAWNIPISNQIPTNGLPEGAVQGVNDFGNNNYGGPCPPSGKHRYFFKIYALDTPLDISEKSDKQDLEKAMEGHILAEGKLVGLYEKQGKEEPAEE